MGDKALTRIENPLNARLHSFDPIAEVFQQVQISLLAKLAGDLLMNHASSG